MDLKYEDNGIKKTKNFHPTYRPDIDGLRAVAILSVILFHAFPGVLQGGFVGVDIFFVISGFLISSIIFRSLHRAEFSFMEFYAHRVKRIFPALILVLIVTFILGWLILLPEDYMQLGKHIAAGAGFLQDFVLWKEAGYFDTASALKPLMHLWSLAIEEQFYLIYPVLIWAAWKLRLNLLMVVLVIALLSFITNIVGISKDAVGTFFVPQTRFWELLAGSALAYLYSVNEGKLMDWLSRRGATSSEKSSPQKSLNSLLSIFGLLLLVTAVFGLDKSKSFPGWWALVPVAGSFLLIMAGPDAWGNRKILASKTLVFVGLISYPLYLWHWPILSFAQIVKTDTPTPGIRMAALILSFLLAWLTYRLVEKPIRFGSYQRFKVTSLASLIILVGCVGYATFSLGGFESRFPSSIRNIASFKYDPAKDARAGECWLSATAPYDGFSKQCFPPSKNKDSILVWGDSHAGRLYTGLQLGLGNEKKISQFNRDSCPPVLGYGYDICQKSNEYILSQIKKNPPQTVVMFAVWHRYQTDWTSDSPATKGLHETIKKLKSVGVKNIVVLGPGPEWTTDLPKLIYAAWKSDYPFHKIPDRLSVGIKSEVFDVDKQIEQLLCKEPVRYVSLLNMMWKKDEGCLTHVPGQPEALLTWDYGHLTTEGAFFVYKHLSKTGLLLNK